GGAGQKDSRAFGLWQRGEDLLGEALAFVLRWEEIRADPACAQGLGCLRTDGADPRVPKAPGVGAFALERVEDGEGRVLARKRDHIVLMELPDRLFERRKI